MTEIDVEPVERVEDTDDGEGADAEPGRADAGSEAAAGASDDALEIEWTEEGEWEPTPVDAPEYVLYGGKGGVGKTTMAAATGLASAASGTATLVVSTDPAHSLSDTLGVDVPSEPTRVRGDMPLFAVEIDPDAAAGGPFGEGGFFGGADDAGGGFDGDDANASGAGGANPFDGGDENPFAAGGENPFGADADGNPLGGLGDLFGEDGPSPMGGPMPGADEAAAMQQLLAYLDDDRFERVVVDTAPTGHTLRLLELPEVMDSMVGRIVKMRERFRGMMGSIKGMFGGDADDAAGVDQLEELADRIERLRTVLRDPDRTDFRVVMIPEEMSVVESERLVQRLTEFGIPAQTLVVNRVMEDLADVAAGTDVSPEWVVSPDLDSCEFCQHRWQVQQRALRRATDLFRGRDVKRVPLLAEEVRGEDALRVVAACLE